MVYSGSIWIWWIGEYRFTLNIKEFIFFIIILSRNKCTATDSRTLFRCELLQSLKCICIMHGIVIDITKKVGVVSKTFVPSHKWVVEMCIHQSSIKELFNGGCGRWNHYVLVLIHTLVEST